MIRKLKSGIVGQATVIFGGAIGMCIGTIKDADDKVLAVGLAELKHPVAKSGDPIIDDETFNQKEFIRLVKESEDYPKTACPSPEMFREAYHCDAENIFVVTLSGPLSSIRASISTVATITISPSWER